MDGLLGIGKGRSTNKILRDAAKQKKGLIQEVEKEQDDDENQVEEGIRKTNLSIASQTCTICRQKKSSYTCPKCNIPYCSLECFRSNKHQRCSESFVRQTIEEEKVGRTEEQNEAGFVDENERKKMMDVLRKLQRLDAKLDGVKPKPGKPSTLWQEDEEEEIDNDEEEEEEEWQDIQEVAQKAGIDLENASVEELMALLKSDEREQFENLIRQAEKSGMHNSIQHLLTSVPYERNGDKEEKKWWEIPKAENFDKPVIPTSFSKEVNDIAKAMQKKTNGSALEWNIVAVTLAYVYVIRHLDIENLQFQRIDTESKIAVRLFQHLIPFLANSSSKTTSTNPLSQMTLNGAEDVTLWFLSKLNTEAGPKPAEMMHFLYNQIYQNILQTSKVLITDTNMNGEGEICQNLMYLFYDLHGLMNKIDRRKVVFYAAYWKSFVSSCTKQYSLLLEEMGKEIDRLKTEMERTEDEERWQAAHNAVEQNGGILLPK